MSEEKRIEVRKIYVGKAALFGLLLGLIIGIIAGLVLMILVITGTSKIPYIGDKLGEGKLLLGLIAFFGSVFFIAISICVLMFICSLFYNLVFLMGARMHFGMAEYEERGMAGGAGQQTGQQGYTNQRIQGGVQIRV